MKLTTKSEYSLLVLIYMAKHADESWIKVNDICSKYGIPKKYAEQLLTILRQNRYVKTKRGANGGYSLAKPANEINVAEIVRLMDGALAPSESVSTYFFSVTPVRKEEKICSLLKEIRDFISDKLENTKISDLIS